MICSDYKLQAELRKIFSILLVNGYPDHVIEKTIAKLKDFTSSTSHTVKKCSVYIYLPWLGIPSVGLENKIKTSVEKCFFVLDISLTSSFN